MIKKHLVVLTGAGMSAESGLKTFRDENGLWEGHDVTQVASPEGFKANPELVLDFYNQRRRQLKTVQPNEGHVALAKLEKDYKVSIITQNIDDLHERAGSSDVTHLHGELFKVESTGNPKNIKAWTHDLNIGDLCEAGYQLRPHVVWFGEAVPKIETAAQICSKADILVIIGTSMAVYPAASLMHYAPKETPIFYIDPKPAEIHHSSITVLPYKATEGLQKLKEQLEDLQDP